MTWQPIETARRKVRGQIVYSLAERLARNSRRDDLSDCVLWLGAKRNGYGSLMIGSREDGTRKTARAHRVAYELYCGPIPAGHEVCHKCDVPACINPKHLFLGTRQDNVADRQAKGRGRFHVGSAVWNAKLTEAAVQEIRSSRESNAALATRFGVSVAAIKDAKARRWEHVPAPPGDSDA